MKRLVAIVLMLIILASLAACGSEPQMRCGECGKSVSANTAFCEYCGAKLSANVGAGSPVTENTNATDNSEQDIVDSNYEEFLTLIEAGQYEEAYKKLDALESKETADELRSKFVIIEDILVSQVVNAVEDNLGNVYDAIIIDFKYDTDGNLVEIAADKNLPSLTLKNTFNPYMKYVAKTNYHPYLEKLSYKDGKMIKVTGYQRDSDQILYAAEFSYDANGNIEKVDYVYSTGATQTLYTYNDNNQLVQVDLGESFASFQRIINIQYDENGNILEEGTVYDNNGRIIESSGDYWTSGDLVDTTITWNYGDFYIYIG